jgi:fructokinase
MSSMIPEPVADMGNGGPSLITCLGELLIDFLPITEDDETVGFRMHAGGSMLNVAVAAARLDRPVELAGAVSGDMFGRFLRRHVERERVGTRWLVDVAAPTTLAFVATERGEPRFAFYGDGAADTRLLPGDLPEAMFLETGVLHVGSISLLRGTTPDAVLAACARQRGHGLVSVDPNVRPDLVSDEVGYRALLERLFALADVVKLSDADAAWLAPGVQPEQLVRDILELGPALVVVTRGADGVVAARQSSGGPAIHRLPAYQVQVADTVGAGDTFSAGLLVRLVDRGVTSHDAIRSQPAADVEADLRFAAAAAAINCMRPGADPPDRPTVLSFMSRS